MTIKAILWTYEKRQDGTADVKIYCYPPKKYHSTGIKVKAVDWDKAKGRVKPTNPSAAALNARIERLIGKYTEELHLGEHADVSLVAFAELFIEEIKRGLHPIRPSTAKNYQATLSRLKLYCRTTGKDDLTFYDCTPNWHAEFSRWLVDFADCGPAGVAKHTKIIKRLMRVAEERELHRNTKYRLFKINRRTTKKIYLRPDEIELLEKIDLSDHPHLSRERDRFLISYYLLLRFGDSIRIHRNMLFADGEHQFLRYTSEKTSIPVVIPVKPQCLKLLDRNNWDLAGTTNQESNRHLKTIAAMAGIEEIAKEGEVKSPKWKFVTTHTARRSAATNMALAGVEIDTIAKLGGWDKIGTLKAYLRASGVDVARAAVALDFFR